MSEQLDYFTLNREGGEVKFPILAPDDEVALIGDLRTWRKTQLAINLQISGVTGMACVAELNKQDARKILYSDLVQWANTPDGQLAFILRSMRKEKPETTAADIGRIVRRWEMLMVAAGVANLKVESTEGKKTESPLGEAASGTTETGDLKAA